MMDFEIMPFPLSPPHIRWAAGKFSNKEYGDTIFETVDDVDLEGDFDFSYSILFDDGTYAVTEDYDQALWEIILSIDHEEELKGRAWIRLFQLEEVGK